MAPLGALSRSWVSAEASLPLGWQISGLWRFDDLWTGGARYPAVAFVEWLADEYAATGRRPRQADDEAA